MWQQLFNLIKLAFTFAEKLQKIDATLKEHSRHIEDLTANQARLYHEILIQRERDAREREREIHERDKEILRLENQRLRERLERLSLPPSTPSKLQDEKED